MDEAHMTLLAVTSSLARLRARMLKLSHRQLMAHKGRLRRVARDHWTVGDLAPPSEWPEATPPRTALSGAIAAVSLAQHSIPGSSQDCEGAGF